MGWFRRPRPRWPGPEPRDSPLCALGRSNRRRTTALPGRSPLGSRRLRLLAWTGPCTRSGQTYLDRPASLSTGPTTGSRGSEGARRATRTSNHISLQRSSRFMSTLWDDTPSALKSGGALDSLQPVLESVHAHPAGARRGRRPHLAGVDDDGRWAVASQPRPGYRRLQHVTDGGAEQRHAHRLPRPPRRRRARPATRERRSRRHRAPGGQDPWCVRASAVPARRGPRRAGSATGRPSPSRRQVPPPRDRRAVAASQGRRHRRRAEEQHARRAHAPGPDLRLHPDGAGARAGRFR